jgi:SNF2 family DNA or RNA helicase
VVEGAGWAVDLVHAASDEPPAPLGAPEGFDGDLRSYQAEARGWLGFLDRVGLGGCLAMDMGLGKTPTLLAHVLATRGDGPVLVIAPPAVLGNWYAEAARFTPDLRSYMHHGQGRAGPEELAEVAGRVDLVLTTYATAVRDVEALEAIDWRRVVLDEAQAIKNPASEAARELRRIPARSRLALTGTPVENGLGDLWSILDFTNPGLVGPRNAFVTQLSRSNGSARGNGAEAGAGAGAGSSGTTGGGPGGAEAALRALNGLLVFRRTKAEPEIAAELPDKIDELDHCGMTPEQIGLYQAVLDDLLSEGLAADNEDDRGARTHHVLAAITALKQICDHPAAYVDDDPGPLEGRSGKLARLEELIDTVFAAGERMLIFTHFARWGERLADYLSERTGRPIACYHGGLSRSVRDRVVREFQEGSGPGALVLSIKAGGSGLNLTAANHVVLYDRWWNPAVEDQARDRAWRIGQANTVVSHRLVCPGTVDEQVEEVVAGKRRIADLVLPASSSVGDLNADQLRSVLGLRPEAVLDEITSREAVGDQGDVETAA